MWASMKFLPSCRMITYNISLLVDNKVLDVFVPWASFDKQTESSTGGWIFKIRSGE